MTKREIVELLREAIRQARIDRDSGNPLAHERVLRLTQDLTTVKALSALGAKQWGLNRGLDAYGA